MTSFRETIRPVLRSLSIVLCLMLISGCFPTREKDAYHPPAALDTAVVDRTEFVDSFLQGYWCDAQQLFARSVDGYLRQDDFCEAAHNYVLAWKLTAYIGQPDDALLEEATRLVRTGSACNKGLPYDPASPAVAVTDAEKRYLSLLQEKKYGELHAALLGEEDPLYRSVYARKGARAAMDNTDRAVAGQMIDLARETDAAQGWVVFLHLDWGLAMELANDPGQREALAERMRVLKGLIQPCPPAFMH